MSVPPARGPALRRPIANCPNNQLFRGKVFRLDFQNSDLVDQFACGEPRSQSACHLPWVSPSIIELQVAREAPVFISSKTPGQSPGLLCRKSRMVGYQGLSLRWSSQRQSGTSGSATHTGTPIAPAKWAIAVSEVITKSRFFMTAAVSMNGPGLLIQFFRPDRRPANRRGPAANCSLPAPFCRLIKRLPGSAPRRRNVAGGWNANSRHDTAGFPASRSRS